MFRRTGIPQYNVMHAAHSLHSQIMPLLLAFPHNFIAKILFAKHSIHSQLEIVAGGRVAVQIDASRWFQHAAHS